MRIFGVKFPKKDYRSSNISKKQFIINSSDAKIKDIQKSENYPVLVVNPGFNLDIDENKSEFELYSQLQIGFADKEEK